MSTDTAPVDVIKYIAIDRSQMRLVPQDVDQIIPPDHPARLIWEVAETLDFSAFEEGTKSQEGRAGRPCWPARLLASVWIYAYSMGTPSARAIERMMEHEPGLRWLTGLEVINYHTLASFRVGHGEALKELFAQFLLLLDIAGVVDLRTILHDGTKVRAVAGRGSYHRRQTLEKHLLSLA